MLIISVILFLIAAVFGLINLSSVLKNRRAPSLAVLAHGSFAVIALFILIAVIASGHTSTLLISSLGLFILAALGGFTLLSFDLRNRPIPKMLALGHPIFAIIAIILLILYALGY